MLENYLKAQNHKFPGWTCIEGKLTAPNGNFARWFATDTPTAVESFHGKFLVRIIEEAKSFPDEIFDQTNRWQPKLTIMVSSKGLMQGRLYEALTKDRQYYRVHEVDASMCPWIPQRWIDEQIAQYGRESAIIKSMIFNEFSDVDVKNLISLEQINRCFTNPQPWRNPGFRVAGIDLSAAKKGGDEMVAVIRQGNKLFEPYFLPYCESEMEAVGLLVRWLKKEQIKYVYADNGGLGSPMISRLAEILGEDKQCILHRVDFGDKKFLNPSLMNYNKGTELWSIGANKIELRDLIFDWTQESKAKFIAQTTSRSVSTSSDGHIRLESKEDMRGRGLKSPDLADATFLALIEPPNEAKSSLGLTSDWTKYKSGVDDNQQWAHTTKGRSLGRG